MEELLDRLERGWTLEEHRMGWFIRGTEDCKRDDVIEQVRREWVMELEVLGVVRLEEEHGRMVGVYLG